MSITAVTIELANSLNPRHSYIPSFPSSIEGEIKVAELSETLNDCNTCPLIETNPTGNNAI